MATNVATQPTVAVTPDNFNRAESHFYFNQRSQESGVGKLHHNRELMPIDKQTVIRANRDTLYSSAVFDLDAGPVTVTLPDAGDRYLSRIVIDEDQYTPGVVYAPGRFTFTRDQVGTRYGLVGVRTFVDPSSPEDLAQV